MISVTVDNTTATLRGRVVDAADGTPLPGVRIVARSEGGAFVARSGADGRYSVRGLSPRSYRLTAEDDRFVPWSRTVRVAPGRAETQDVPLTRGATLAGRVAAFDLHAFVLAEDQDSIHASCTSINRAELGTLAPVVDEQAIVELYSR